MRITLVAPFGLRARGTTRARALPLARALARRGHTVALFIPPYDSPADSGRRWWNDPAAGDATADADVILSGSTGQSPLHSQDSEESLPIFRTGNGVEVVNVPLPGRGQGGALWHLRLAWRLLCAVRAWQPDVVHVFKPKGPSGLVSAALWLMRRLRLSPRHSVTLSPCHLVTLSPCHLVIVDSDDWEGPGGWNDDPRAGYLPLQRRFFAWQERYGLSHADAWTVASECLRDRAIRFGANPDRVFVLPNGVPDWILDIGYWHTQHPISNIQSLLLYTRFAGVRPADVAIIWRQVAEKMPGARLTVVGRGLAREEAELAGLPGVEVMGWVEPEELPALFAKMMVAVVPWADTPANRARSSVKVRELMTAGLPVVAYAVGELPATLGDAGVLVRPGDDRAFAEAVVALLGDPARAARLGAAARERARTEFNWDRLAEVALAAYAAAGL